MKKYYFYYFFAPHMCATGEKKNLEKVFIFSVYFWMMMTPPQLLRISVLIYKKRKQNTAIEK